MGFNTLQGEKILFGLWVDKGVILSSLLHVCVHYEWNLLLVLEVCNERERDGGRTETHRERHKERQKGYTPTIQITEKNVFLGESLRLRQSPHLSPLKIILWPFAFSRPYVFWQRSESQGTSGRMRAEGCLAQVPGVS